MNFSHISIKLTKILRKEIDEMKREICRKKGVILIEIPYNIKFNQMEEFIINNCIEKNIESSYFKV